MEAVGLLPVARASSPPADQPLGMEHALQALDQLSKILTDSYAALAPAIPLIFQLQSLFKQQLEFQDTVKKMKQSVQKTSKLPWKSDAGTPVSRMAWSAKTAEVSSLPDWFCLFWSLVFTRYLLANRLMDFDAYIVHIEYSMEHIDPWSRMERMDPWSGMEHMAPWSRLEYFDPWSRMERAFVAHCVIFLILDLTFLSCIASFVFE